MLTSLRVRNLAVVSSVDVEFDVGFTVLTGETGAGKSILVDALLLALGERASSDVIRHGDDQAEIAATFEIGEPSAAREWLQEQEIELPERTCVLRRTLRRDGRSRGSINGSPVTVQSLRELGRLLVDIQGQHAHQSLLREDEQRRLLDRYAGLQSDIVTLRKLYDEWTTLRARVNALDADRAAQEQKSELRNFQLAEMTELDLGTDEWDEIDAELRRATNARDLAMACEQALLLLSEGDNSALVQSNQAQRLLANAVKIDDRLQETSDSVDSALIQLEESSASLHRYLSDLDIDPARVSWLEERVSRAHALARKHGVSPAELPALRRKLTEEIEEFAESADAIAAIKTDCARALAACTDIALAISKARAESAPKLAKAASTLVRVMGMPNARVEIGLDSKKDATPSPFGFEQVSLNFAANAGEPPRALARVASGGELSRIALAIQVVTTGGDGISTLIFDEVDVGIGGGIAQTVGEQLHKLAADRQVLCVTHQPQVAALGDAHLGVRKVESAGRATTRVESLDREARVAEIARMLGGREITGKTKAHAKEMLASG